MGEIFIQGMCNQSLIGVIVKEVQITEVLSNLIGY